MYVQHLADAIEDTEMPVDVEPRASSPPRETATLLPTLVPALLALVHPTSFSFPPLAATSPYPPITSALSAVHISALECLTNIFIGISTYGNVAIAKVIDSGAKVWDSIWTALAVVGTEISGLGQERRQDMWSTAVGVLWGVGNVWKGSLVSCSADLVGAHSVRYPAKNRSSYLFSSTRHRQMRRYASSAWGP